MKLCSCVLAGTLACAACGCVMYNSTSEINFDTAIIKNRTSDHKLSHSTSNSVTSSVSMEGGSKIDPTISAVPRK